MRMPLTIFSTKGLSGSRRERIETAIIAGGKHTSGPHEAWIAADPFKDGYQLRMTGQQEFERNVIFALHDDPAGITKRVRQTLED